MEDIAARRAAEALLAAHESNVRFEPLGPPHRPATISDAYDIQDRYVAHLRNKQGDVVGYKVGLTSAPMQVFCGIDHPIAGVVLARRVHQSGATIRRSDFGRLGLEFEIAVRIKRSGVTSTAFARQLNSWTIGAPTMPTSMFFRSLRTIPGTAGLCCRNLRPDGPIWKASSGARRRIKLRSARAAAAISSDIPSIQSDGLPASWLHAARG